MRSGLTFSSQQAMNVPWTGMQMRVDVGSYLRFQPFHL
jgi:hypothetical protein